MDFFNSDLKCRTISKCCTTINKCRTKKTSLKSYRSQYIFSITFRTMMMTWWCKMKDCIRTTCKDGATKRVWMLLALWLSWIWTALTVSKSKYRLVNLTKTMNNLVFSRLLAESKILKILTKTMFKNYTKSTWQSKALRRYAKVIHRVHDRIPTAVIRREFTKDKKVFREFPQRDLKILVWIRASLLVQK